MSLLLTSFKSSIHNNVLHLKTSASPPSIFGLYLAAIGVKQINKTKIWTWIAKIIFRTINFLWLVILFLHLNLIQNVIIYKRIFLQQASFLSIFKFSDSSTISLCKLPLFYSLLLLSDAICRSLEFLSILTASWIREGLKKNKKIMD